MSKKKILLKVTSFSYKILRSRYGDSILVNQRSNKDLFDALQKNPVHRPVARRQLLTQEIYIEVTGKLATQLKRDQLPAIGLALHTDHIREMYRWIYAQTTAGYQAFASLENYYIEYDLSEEDFSIDSAYRGWLRFKQVIQDQKTVKKADSVRYKSPFVVLRVIEHFKAQLKGQKIPSSTVQDIVLKIWKAPNDILKVNSRHNKSYLPLTSLYYLWHHLSGLSMRQIGQRVDKAPSTIHHHIDLFEDRIKEDPEYRQKVYNIILKLQSSDLAVLAMQCTAS